MRTARRGTATLALAVVLTLAVARGAGAQETAPRALEAAPFVVAHWPPHEPLARRVLSLARATRLPAIPGERWRGQRITIALAPDARRFDALAPGAPEWRAGVAVPAAGLIVLPAYESQETRLENLPRVLRHELAHIALHRHLAPARAPRWFDEGYARWAAGEWDAEAAWMLRVAFAMRRAPPLDSLALGWPARVADARVAYLLSMSAVDFLHDRGGDRVLGIFLARVSSLGFEPALRATYGVTLSQLEEDWRAQVRRDYGWATTLTSAVVFWFFGGLLVLVLFLLRRRRNRRRLVVLQEGELPDTPAFWLGEEAPVEPPAESPREPPGDAARD